MASATILEQRLEALERAVADLRQKVESFPIGTNWLENLTGSISDDAAFREALEYGRKFRQADQDTDEPGQQP